MITETWPQIFWHSAVPNENGVTSHDAPTRPYVQGRIITCRLQKDLWGTVPPRAHVLCEGGPRADLSCKAEVTNFGQVPCGYMPRRLLCQCVRASTTLQSQRYAHVRLLK
jgi:hypothetical protein